MSLTFGFYNSMNHDRRYNAAQISGIFDGIIEDGVYLSIGNHFAVNASAGMGITINTGRAWFNHTWTLNDAPYIAEVEQSDLLLDRIDAVVLEVDATVPVRANSFKVVQGTPSSSPERPGLIKTELVHQYPLAYIYVRKNTTEITQSDITNMVGTMDCPFVTGVLETISADTLFAQWAAEWREWISGNNEEFQAWFDRIKNQLTEDPAGSLQTQLDTLTALTQQALEGKAAAVHTHTKDEVGLASVDNTADSEKSVLYAQTAGAAVDQTARDAAAVAQTAANTAQTTANARMPIAGGTFTGNVAAYGTNRTNNCLRNIYVNGVSTNYILMVRK